MVASWELNPDAGYHPQPNRGLALDAIAFL